MQITKSERPHISFFGCTNSGKSSLVNAVTNQNLAVVSEVKGTTTDPVEKAMEILPLGPVVIIDTAGVNDVVNDLGKLRVEKSKRVLDKTDIAVLVVDSTAGIQKEDENLIKDFKERKIPYIIALNKSDLVDASPELFPPAEGFCMFTSAKTGEGINELKEKLGHILNENRQEKYIKIGRAHV